MLFPTQEIDALFSGAMQGAINPVLTAMFLAFNLLGHPAFWFFVAALLYWKGEHRKSFYLAAIIAASGLVTAVIKYAVARPRPFEQGFVKIFDPFSIGIHKQFDYSFPSGHATLATAAMLHFRKEMGKFLALGFAAIAMVMLARVYLGVHFLSDVVAGLMLGIIIAKAVEIAMQWIQEHEMRISGIKPLYFGVLAFIAAALAIEYFEVPEMSMALAGYFAGFLAYRELAKNGTAIGLKKLATRAIAGIIPIGMAFVILHATYAPGMAMQAFYFLSGLWITLIYPLIYNNIKVGI